MNLPLKAKPYIVFVSFSFAIMAIGGCTSQSWYEGVKRGAENNCRNQPPSEVDRCLENLNKKTYEEYEKERANQK